MRKEILFAIVAGAVFGLVIGFGVWRANVAVKTSQGEISTEGKEPATNEQAGTKESGEIGLTIAKPDNYAVITSSPYVINGITSSQSPVAISSEKDSIITSADNKGVFEEEFELAGGLNQIIVSAFDDDMNTATKNIVVIYSTGFLDDIETPTPTIKTDEDASESAEVEKNVQQRIDLAKNKPIAYIGTITDILDDTFQIDGLEGAIQQIAYTDQTTYTDITDGSKTIKLEDMAIGDYIIAMGFVNGDSVLDAKRILVSNKLTEPTRKIAMGTITDTFKKEMTISTNDGEINIVFGKSWFGPEVDEMIVGDKVIVITDLDENGDDAVQAIKVINQNNISPIPTDDHIE